VTPQRQIDDWLGRLASERQASPHTVAAYRRDLAKLTRFMQDNDLASFDALDANRMRTFVATEHRGGTGREALAPKSLQRLLSSCRSLFRQLTREGQLHHDPLLGVRGP
jgi:integrase/recombinase XerC